MPAYCELASTIHDALPLWRHHALCAPSAHRTTECANIAVASCKTHHTHSLTKMWAAVDAAGPNARRWLCARQSAARRTRRVTLGTPCQDPAWKHFSAAHQTKFTMGLAKHAYSILTQCSAGALLQCAHIK